MFRWGIMSTARIAREHMIPAIQDSENGLVHAIASRNHGTAQALATRCGASLAFGSYRELLDCPEIDGVYIPLPTSQHVEWAIAAANAGKHVLVEKPLALRAEDIRPVLAARDRNGVLVCEAFMIVYHPQWIKIRELLGTGAIGRLRHVQGAFSYYNVDPANMRNILELGGGALADIGVYPVVATRFVTDQEPSGVEATIERDPTFGTDIYAAVRAQFDGFDLSFYISTQMADRQLMVFHGDEGYIEVRSPFNAGSYDDHRIELFNRSHTEATIFRFPGTKQYRLEAESFVRAARGLPERVFTLEDSIRNQSVIDTIFARGDG